MPIPPHLQRTHTALYGQVVTLHADWKIFTQLFGHSKRRFELLNQTAGGCFGVMEDALYRKILLTLAKIGDPPKSSGQKNATLQTLKSECINEPVGFQQAIDKPLQDFLSFHNKIKSLRNKYLAHYDYETHTTSKVISLPSRTAIESALQALRDFMNLIDQHFCNSTTSFAATQMPSGDGEALVWAIKRGMHHRKAFRHDDNERERFEQSEWYNA